MLLFNAEIVNYLQLHSSFCHDAACGPSWRLYFFYFGCCFVSIGSTIYAFFCPKIVRKHEDAATFFEAEKAFQAHATSLAQLFQNIEAVKGASAYDPNNLKETVVKQDAGLNVDHINMVAGPMSEYYYFQNRLHPSARLATFMAYLIGGVLLLAPTAVTTYQIVQIVF